MIRLDTATDLRAPSLVAHLRQLLRALPIALAVGLIVGLITFGVFQAEAPKYLATATAQIDAQIPVVPGDAYLYQNTAPYLSLATSGVVQSATAKEMGAGWTTSDVSSNVTVTVAQSPLLLQVDATGPTPDEAIKLAMATITTLDSAAQAQRMNELQRAVTQKRADREALQEQISALPRTNPSRAALINQRDAIQGQIDRILDAGVNRLSMLSVPSADGTSRLAPRSPTAAVFVGIITFLIALEAVALLRGRIGRRLVVDSIRRTAAATGMPIETTTEFAEPPVTFALVDRSLREYRTRTLILASPSTRQCVTQWTSHRAESCVVETLDTEWPRHLEQGTVHVVFAVAVHEPIRPDFEASARMIKDLDLTGRIVVVTGQSTTNAKAPTDRWPAAENAEIVPASTTVPATNSATSERE